MNKILNNFTIMITNNNSLMKHYLKKANKHKEEIEYLKYLRDLYKKSKIENKFNSRTYSYKRYKEDVAKSNIN